MLAKWMWSLEGSRESWEILYGLPKYGKCITLKEMERKLQRDSKWCLKNVVCQLWKKQLIGCGKHLPNILISRTRWLNKGEGHILCFLPKFHPELNPIERMWAQLKRFTKAHCKCSLPSLRKNIPLAYDSVTIENIRNHFRKVRHYMFGYLVGLTPGKSGTCEV